MVLIIFLLQVNSTQTPTGCASSFESMRLTSTTAGLSFFLFSEESFGSSPLQTGSPTVDPDDPSLPIQRFTNGYLPSKTIEKPFGAMVISSKIIIRPSGPMVARPQNIENHSFNGNGDP